MATRMARFLTILALVVGVAFFCWGTVTAQGTSAPATKAEVAKGPTYVGVGKCKMCHSAEAKGAQYKKWSESLHAKAFATLGTPEAAEMAKKAGVTGNPQQAPQCLECHTTGFHAPAEARATVKPEDGVSCEECHGPGSSYQAMAVMKAVWNGETAAASVGLMLPDEKTCVRCHNSKSPTFKSFEFKTMLAKIAHPYPAELAKTRKQK